MRAAYPRASNRFFSKSWPKGRVTSARSRGLRLQYSSRLSLSEGSCLAATRKCSCQLSISVGEASSNRKQRVKPASVCALVRFVRQVNQCLYSSSLFAEEDCNRTGRYG